MNKEKSDQWNERKVELLAPAGNREAFRGALHAGADAVYLAGQSFGARAYAENFSEEEIVQALREAHLFGVRVYLAANVLTRERELTDLVSFVSCLYEKGLDGVIVQDLGAAAALRTACPGLPLHASTQMSVMGPDAARFLQRMGFTRIVPARELSLKEIRAIKETGTEVETFIHGAMCYSCSGRCLMSSYLGGRSGNRGRCAGTCRLPYEIFDEEGRQAELRQEAGRTHAGAARDGHLLLNQAGVSGGGSKDPALYPLSMKDLCVLPILPDLMDAGIDSFKIEGRMKKPEYAAGVTAIYRKYVDRYYDWDAQGRPGTWEIASADLEDLQSLYIRTNLSTGYYHERNGRDMVTIGEPGYRGASEELLTRIRREYIETGRKLPICGKVRIAVGEPVRLEVWASYHDTIGGDRPKTRTSDMAATIDHEAVGGKHSTMRQMGVSYDFSDNAEAGKAGCSFAAEGDAAEPAQKRPLTEESIREKLEKTGDTLFEFTELSISTDGRSFVPVSALNELRRMALEGLQEEIYCSRRGPVSPESAASRTNYDRADKDREDKHRTDKGRPGKDRAGKDRADENRTDKNRTDKNRTDKDRIDRDRIDRDGTDIPYTFVMTQSVSQADAVLQFDVDGVILDGEIRDHPEHVLQYIRMADNKTASFRERSEGKADALSSDHRLLRMQQSGDRTAASVETSDDKTTASGERSAAGKAASGGERSQKAGTSRRVLIIAALPQILRESDEGWLERYYARYREAMDGFLIRCLEELEFLRGKGYKGLLIADSSLYCWNRSALEVWKPYCDYNVLPLELNRKEMEQTFEKELPRMLLTVYGRAPMMITANCVRKTGGRCPGKREQAASGSGSRPTQGDRRPSGPKSGTGNGRSDPSYQYLQDRTGAVFPVQIDCAHCHNVIYNSVPTSLLSCLQDPKDRLMQSVGGRLLSFTEETGEETRRVLEQFCQGSRQQAMGGQPEPAARPGRGAPFSGTRPGERLNNRTASFTYGHYRRGAQ